MPKVSKDQQTTTSSANSTPVIKNSPGQNPPSKKGRKRKNPSSEEGSVVPRKYKKRLDKDDKKPQKQKISRDKGPVDKDKQCGVEMPNGQLCSRSLTCKTHSMGAKRAVKGRTRPFDVLLAEYQKRNQVKMASLSTQHQLNLDNEALMEDTPLNAEEEFEQVMAGVLRAYPAPLERKVIMPTKTRTNFFRMREKLISAISTIPPLPSTGSISIANQARPSGLSPQQQSINAVMAATGAVLGRTFVFNTSTGMQYTRPPRVFVNNNPTLSQQQQALYWRQKQVQLHLQQQEQRQLQLQQQQLPQQTPPQTLTSSNATFRPQI